MSLKNSPGTGDHSDILKVKHHTQSLLQNPFHFSTHFALDPDCFCCQFHIITSSLVHHSVGPCVIIRVLRNIMYIWATSSNSGSVWNSLLQEAYPGKLYPWHICNNWHTCIAEAVTPSWWAIITSWLLFKMLWRTQDRGLEESVCVRMRVHVCVHAVA